MEADSTASRPRRNLHQLANCADDLDELFVMCAHATFELVQPPGNIGIRGDDFSYPHERSHDFDIYVNGALTSKNTGKHRHALLGKSVRGPPKTHFCLWIGGHNL